MAIATTLGGILTGLLWLILIGAVIATFREETRAIVDIIKRERGE